MDNIIWSPQPRQSAAMSCPAQELFYGGAAGGGKSDFLLGDFLQGASRYGEDWTGILFRQTNSQLEELQKRAREIYGAIGATYKLQDRTWSFPNGATLKMRYLESERDVEHYQGHQYTWVGFDELGNYPTPFCWEYMSSRLRSAKGVPCYQRGTGNPGGAGHGWIKQYFMDGHEPNKIWEKKVRLADGSEAGKTICFIPSLLDDNKVLMSNDPGYEARLMSLPPHLAKALRFGDWSVFEGQVFAEFTEAKHVIKPFPLLPGQWFKFCSLDWGYSKPYSLGWYAVNADGRIIKYREWYGCEDGRQNEGVRESSASLAERAMEISATEGVVDMVADPAIWSKNDDAMSIAEIFARAGWEMHRANNDRFNGLIVFHDALKETCDDNGTPVFTVFNTCRAFIRTIPMLTPDPNRPEDVDSRLEDHVYDETRYALMSDYAKHPQLHLRRQAGGWETETRSAEYNPLDNL